MIFIDFLGQFFYLILSVSLLGHISQKEIRLGNGCKTLKVFVRTDMETYC